MNKELVVAAFRALLQSRLDALDAEAQAARAGTRVDGSHRPANRGERGAVTAQGYLAHGLAERAARLREDLALLADVDLSPRDRVGAGALLRLGFEDGEEDVWMLLPGGQGDRVVGVLVLSPTAPSSRALTGREAGDALSLRRGGQQQEASLLSVS